MMTIIFLIIEKAAYDVTKSGLNYLIETLSEEGKVNRYSANGIAPSIIDIKANRIWAENEADLISSEEIGKVVNSIFEQFKIISGNIFKLPFTLKF